MTTWTVRSIVGTMFPLLIGLSILVMLGSGFILQELEETYLSNPVLLLMVPVMIGMGGNIGSILSSRFSTEFHLGTLSFGIRDASLWTDILTGLVLALAVFTTLGFVAYAIGHLLGAVLPLATLLTISLVSGMTIAAFAIGVSILATYASYHFQLDPDDTTIPIVTNLCDIFGVIILSGVILLLL
jgi:mgtE-like transporter